VYLLGPTVKTAGFATLLRLMAAISACATLFVSFLPRGRAAVAPVLSERGAPPAGFEARAPGA
jgi:hypothetical protein